MADVMDSLLKYCFQLSAFPQIRSKRSIPQTFFLKKRGRLAGGGGCVDDSPSAQVGGEK